MNHYRMVNTRRTSQSMKARSDQVKNSAGGYAFAMGDLDRVKRFLILGSDAPTYYASARDLTFQNFDALRRMAETDPNTLVDTIVEISEGGRAPKVQPALFALAIACSLPNEAGRRYALNHLSRVARTATHLFTFINYVQQFRGWGPALTKAISAWYLDKEPDTLAYQMVKYRSREGWTHRDVPRQAHPKPVGKPQHNALLGWATQGRMDEELPELVRTFTRLQEEATTARLAVALIQRSDHRITWEMLPNHLQSDPKVWAALVEMGMPITALMRNLPRLTRLGVLKGSTLRRALTELADEVRLIRGRVHPVSVLLAQRTYASGRGKGSTWSPMPAITDALDEAFYKAFGSVQPSGKRTLLGIDVSASMGVQLMNSPITAREMAAAMSLVTMKTEAEVHAVGFTAGPVLNQSRTFHGNNGYQRVAVTPLDLSPRRRLDDMVSYMSRFPHGGTDCALPMLYAEANKLEVDTFIIMTDNETWHGDVHPYQALEFYRQQMGIDAKLVVAGFTATNFSIADPDDPKTLDVVGMDSSIPTLIADFSAGR
jgi:60 kDa SS-A/Ro ribonucleoprotein